MLSKNFEMTLNDYSQGTFPAEYLFSEHLFLDTCFIMNYFFFFNWISPSFNICNFSCFRSQLFRNVSVLKNYIKFTKKHRCWSLFLKKWQTSYFQPAAFIKKETLARVFSCKFCQISKNIFFIEQLRVTASVTSMSLKHDFEFIVYFSPNFYVFYESQYIWYYYQVEHRFTGRIQVNF